MEKFSKETPNYRSNNVFARLSEPHLSLSRAATIKIHHSTVPSSEKYNTPETWGIILA